MLQSHTTEAAYIRQGDDMAGSFKKSTLSVLGYIVQGFLFIILLAGITLTIGSFMFMFAQPVTPEKRAATPAAR